VFIVISAPADRAQFFDEGVAIPKRSGHTTISTDIIVSL
jgi:hypothetical protein